MSGRYPNRAGLHGFIGHNAAEAVSSKYTFLSETLSQGGYASHMVGKWHLGYWDWQYVPTGRGFESFFGYMGGAEDYYQHTHPGCSQQPTGPGYPELDLAITFPNRTIKSQPQFRDIYANDVWVPYTQRLLANHPKDTPLFLFLPIQQVHEPLQVPESFVKPYGPLASKLPKDRITFMGMVSALDAAISAVVDSFKENGLWDDTLMIFSTDNGGNLGAGGNNYPLRGGKFTFWEGGNRGIGFLHSASEELLPERLRGSSYDGLFHVADWYATLCNMAGLAAPTSAIDSVSQWAALRGEASAPRTEIVHETVLEGGNLSVGKLRSGKWNLYFGNPGEKANGWYHPNGTVEPGPKTCDTGKACLFDLEADVTEHTDVAAEHPDVVKELFAKLLAEAECPDGQGMCELDRYSGPNSACDAFDVYGAYGPWASIAPAPPSPAPTPGSVTAHAEYRHGDDGCLALGSGEGSDFDLELVGCKSDDKHDMVWEESLDSRGNPQILGHSNFGVRTCLNILGARCEAGAIVHAGPCQEDTTALRQANHFHWNESLGAIASDFCIGFCVDAVDGAIVLAKCVEVSDWSRGLAQLDAQYV